MLLMLQQNWTTHTDIADGNIKQYSHSGSLVVSFKRNYFFLQTVLGQQCSHLEKDKLDPCFTPYTTLNSKHTSAKGTKRECH